MMKDRVVVAKADIIGADGAALVFLAQNLTRLEDLGDEHGPFALRSRREEVKILPNGATYRARNSDVVLESRPTSTYRLEDEILHDRTTFGPQPAASALVVEREVSCGVPHHQPAKAFVADQYVRAEAEDEIWDVEVASDHDGIRELVGGCSFEIEIGWSANAERRIWRENLIVAESRYCARVPVVGEVGRDAAGDFVETTA